MLETRDLVIRRQPHWLRLAVLGVALLMNPNAMPAEPDASRENEEADRPTTTEKGEKTGKTERPSLGRLLELNGAVFTLDNLVITGNMDREWCEKEIAKLRKSGDLIEKSVEESVPGPSE